MQMRVVVKVGREHVAKTTQGQDEVEIEAGLRLSPRTSGRVTNGPEGESEKSRPASATGHVPGLERIAQDVFDLAVFRERPQKATVGNFRRYA